MAKHNATGALGEMLAEQILVKKGYQIHFRNWRTGKKEIDLIASYDNQWIFVEVKTRRSNAFGYPEDAVDARKKGHMREAAAAFLLQNPTGFPTLRYDVVSITFFPAGEPECIHYEDAFY